MPLDLHQHEWVTAGTCLRELLCGTKLRLARAFACEDVKGDVVYEFTGDELPTTARLPSQSTLRFSFDWEART